MCCSNVRCDIHSITSNQSKKRITPKSGPCAVFGTPCLIAKGKTMNKKTVVKYLLAGTATLFGSSYISNSVASPLTDKKEYNINVNDNVKQPIDSVAAETQWDEIEPIVVETIDKKSDILYIMNTGDTICRSGGSRAWRNNNPGCLVYSKFTREKGALGKGGKFAVFPSEQTGRAALADLLRGDGYKNLSIERAIIKYAPPYENDVARYKQRLRKMTGLPLNKRLGDLNSEEMEKVVSAICVIEGWRTGEIEHRESHKSMLAARRNKMITDSLQRQI